MEFVEHRLVFLRRDAKQRENGDVLLTAGDFACMDGR